MDQPTLGGRWLTASICVIVFGIFISVNIQFPFGITLLYFHIGFWPMFILHIWVCEYPHLPNSLIITSLFGYITYHVDQFLDQVYRRQPVKWKWSLLRIIVTKISYLTWIHQPSAWMSLSQRKMRPVSFKTEMGHQRYYIKIEKYAKINKWGR